MEYKIYRTSLLSLTIAFELVVLNSHFYRKKILDIASQCGNRRTQDSRHYLDRYFGSEIPSQSWKTLIKLLSFRFQQCF